MENLVSLDEAIPQQTPAMPLVSLTDEQKFKVDDKTAQERAKKADFALGEHSPGADVIYNSIATGSENDFRSSVAAQMDVVKSQQRMRQIDELTRKPDFSANDVALIQAMTSEKPTSPESVLEELYGRSFIKNAVDASTDSDAPLRKGKLSKEEYKMAEDAIAKNQIIRNTVEDFQTRWENTSTFTKAWDFGEQLVPGLSTIHNWGIDTGNPTTQGTLSGDVIESKVQELLALSPSDLAKQLPKTVKQLADTNVFDAQNFVAALQSYGKTARFADNFLSVVDAADIAGSVVGIGAKAVRGGKAAKNVVETAGELAAREARRQEATALRDVVNASGVPFTKPEDLHAAVGDISRAAEVGAIRRLNDIPTDSMSALEEVGRVLPSAYKPEGILSNVGTLAREATDRLYTALKRSEEVVQKILTDPIRVGRLTPEQEKVALKEAYQHLEKDFQGTEDAILDVRLDPVDLNAANTQTVTMTIGATNATPFPSLELAEFYARDLYGLPDYKVVQRDGGFVVEVQRAVDETTPGVRGAAPIETNAVETKSLGDAFLEFLKSPMRSVGDLQGALFPWMRGADELLAKGQNEGRKAAEFGFKETLRMAQEIAQPLSDLSRTQKKDLEKVLKYNRNMTHPETGERGYFYKTVGELEDAYMDRIGRLPTEKEIEAYYANVKLYDLDWSLRNLALFREKSRIGLKRFNFEYRAADADGKPVFKRSNDFEGVEREDVPWTTAENASVLFYDETNHTPTVFQKNSIDAPTRERYQQMTKDGTYKVIQVDNPTNPHFKELTGSNEPILFVMVRNYEKKELSWKQLDYNPGGHVDYQHPWYIKQAKIIMGKGGQSFYGGDFTVFNFSTQAQARKFEKAMNEARVLFKNKDDVGLADYVRKNLPYTPDQFKALFAGEDGLDINQTFHVVKKGRKISDDVDLRSMYPNLKDYSTSDYNMSGEINRKYAGARSGPLMTITEKGTDANPVFKLQPAKLVDPFPTLSRAVSNAANTRFLGDYKIAAVEDWVARYGDVLAVDKSELMRNPMFYLHRPAWDMRAENALKLQEAMAARSAIMNLTGQQTFLGKGIETIKQKLYSSIYHSFGGDTATRIVDLSDNGLGGMRDPASFMRGVAFHTSLGLFNPIQLFTQAQGVAHIMAISPKQGLAGAAAYWPTRMLMRNPTSENIAYAAEKMAKLGWKKEDYKEAVEAMFKDGWAHVGHEYSWRNDLQGESVYSKNGKSFLDKGTIFFKEGETVIRLMSYMASYREWKAANPAKTFDMAARRAVLDRADLMSVNMTGASQAAMQRGIFSIPTQFFGYQLRMMDQFLGKRLTGAEKARLFGTYSMLYGVPSAMGGAFLYPFYDDVREAALERKLQDNAIVKGLVEGVPTLIAGMLGAEEQNIASRYGPGGIRLGHKDMMDIVLGASGGSVGRIFASGKPFVQDMYTLMTEGGSYEPVLQDVIDVSRNISSVNSVAKTLMALNTGKYYSKSGAPLTNMTNGQAIFTGITGLEPLALSDAYIKAGSMKAQKELENAARKEYTLYIQRGTEERAKGNLDAAKAWWTKARAVIIAADINHQKQMQWIGDSLEGREDMVDSINNSFINNAPASQYEQRK